MKTAATPAVLLSVGALMAAFGLAGCQESVAYINIPADRGDMAGHDPDASRVASVEAAALRAVAAEYRVKAPATFLLPPDTKHATYRKVLSKTGAPFVLPEEAQADAPVYEVRSIRVRGGSATVDVVSKGDLRPLMLTEVSLDYRTDLDGIGWRASAVEPRRVLPAPAKHAAPKPEAKPEPKPEPKPETKVEAKAEADGTAEAVEETPSPK